MKKLLIILFNILIISIQLITCAGCRKYFAPNNHHYSKVNENPKLINKDPKLQLNVNDRFYIPEIHKQFNEPIKDFTSPHYIEEDTFNQNQNIRSRLNKEDNTVDSNFDNAIDNNLKNDTINNEEKEEEIDINLEETN